MPDLFDVEPEVMPNGGAQTPVDIVADGHTLQQVKTAYTTAVAVQNPRNLKQVQERLNQEAALLGERSYYGWAAGRDRIEGPSHELAVAAARCYGNCAVDHQPVQETPSAYYFTASFVDLETGMTITRPFRQSKKWAVYGKMDEFRKEDIRFQIGASKAARNVILEAIPSTLIDNAMEEAKRGVRASLDKYIEKNGIEAARQVMMKALAKEGVSEALVLAKIERAAVAAITADDLVVLKGDLRALQEGAESRTALFPDKQEQPKSEGTPQTQAERVKAAAKAETTEESAETETAPQPILEDQIALILQAAQDKGHSEEEVSDYCQAHFDAPLRQCQADHVEPILQALQEDNVTDWTVKQSTQPELPNTEQKKSQRGRRNA